VTDSSSLCLMEVHAHPDDECYSGGVFGLYGAEGIRTVLVTCTLGEEGEIVDPTMDAEAIRPRLAEVRTEELRCSAATLGVGQLYLLGYRDSGMAESAANSNPAAFTNVGLQDATRRLVAIVRRERPQVMVTYDEQGGYGHPDHIMAHRIAVEAFEGAGDAERFPEGPEMPPPWQPSKLYYIVFELESLMQMARELAERGLPNPFAGGQPQEGGSEQQQGEQPPSFFRPASEITTTVDTSAYADRVLASFRCHRTQIASTAFPLALPEDLARAAVSRQWFVLARSRMRSQGPEGDLFAGVR
jgi:mycothiol conjugate amidase Mca